MGKTSNRYDDEFKAHAVSLVVDKGRPISAVAADLGVSQPALRRWVKRKRQSEYTYQLLVCDEIMKPPS